MEDICGKKLGRFVPVLQVIEGRNHCLDPRASDDNRTVVRKERIPMICEKIIGKLDSQKVSGKKVEYVDIDWDDAFKKIHKRPPMRGRSWASAWMIPC